MTLTPAQENSVPFKYAADVLAGRIVVGRRIVQAVERFYRWIEEADAKGFYLDHSAGMAILNFFPTCINHTVGTLQGQPFVLAPFQQFTMYNVFAWKNKATGLRRIRTVYDKRAKKNGKSAEMAGLSLFMMSFEREMAAQVYVGATKEEQAKICWRQAASFIKSPVANPILRKLGFYAQQRIVGFAPTESTMQALGGDSKTQDGINAHLSIIDEYHAHKDDSVKENLESSSVQRRQPLIWHITTAGTNVQSACKRYEDSVIEVLEGREERDSLFIMIHDLDPDDDWNDEAVWAKANPLLGQGLKIESIRDEYEKATLQPSKIPNFKTKHLNMWVDAPAIWIPSEIWMKNKHSLTPDQVLEKFQTYGCTTAIDLSTKFDLSCWVLLSEPDEFGKRYVHTFFWCPADNIEKRQRDDKVPYIFWRDAGYITATPGNVIDYDYIEDTVLSQYNNFYVNRIEIDAWNACQMTTNLQARGVVISEFSQAIGNISHPTKEFEAAAYKGEILHDGNPVLAWMLAGCRLYQDANGNKKVHKGQSNVNGRRIDGIVALIMALGGSLTGADTSNVSVYSNPDYKFEC